MNKQTSEDLFKKIYPSFILEVCVREEFGDRTKTAIYWPHSYGLQRCVFIVLQGCSLLDDGFLYCILSPTGLQNSIGVPRASSAGCSFPYHILSPTSLIPNSSGDPRAPSTWRSLPHLIRNFSGPQLSDFLSWPSYIIVQRPLNRPLNLWNGMFDRHQAEITVMEFTGHSLPVHQSMNVPWDFLPGPISSAKYAYAISFDYWPLECVTSFQRITLEWHVWPGGRSKYNILKECPVYDTKQSDSEVPVILEL